MSLKWPQVGDFGWPPVGGIQVQVWELTPEALARWQQEQHARWDNDGELFSSSGPLPNRICESPVMGLVAPALTPAPQARASAPLRAS